MRGLLSIYLFFATSLINSIIQEHECYDSMYHMSLRLHLTLISGVKMS